MKKLIVPIVFALVLCVSFVSANEMKPKKTYSNVCSELAVLLTPKSAVGQLEAETTVKVKIRINSHNEIIVLETNSNNEELNDYLKGCLNYKKMISDVLLIDSEYVFDVNFQS